MNLVVVVVQMVVWRFLVVLVGVLGGGGKGARWMCESSRGAGE